MDSTIIIVLAIILLILIILNHITIVTTSTSTTQGTCSQTTFGCCPDGVNSKINFYGTNCPGYRPGPGYLPIQPLKPLIGGCVGTQYGCCPNGTTAKVDQIGSNCLLKYN